MHRLFFPLISLQTMLTLPTDFGEEPDYHIL
jgi:hypothetical protein